MVQRRGKPALKGFGGDGSSSSDSDDDAFAAMSKKKKPRIADDVKQTETSSSSTKRHHHVNAARQAKMDSLLEELQTAKPSDPSSSSRGNGGDDYYGTTIENESHYGRVDRYAPMKKGSYVEPGMEHLTTNLFVGNLDPLTTEEELTDAFRQFGELYSLYIFVSYDIDYFGSSLYIGWCST